MPLTILLLTPPPNMSLLYLQTQCIVYAEDPYGERLARSAPGPFLPVAPCLCEQQCLACSAPVPFLPVAPCFCKQQRLLC